MGERRVRVGVEERLPGQAKGNRATNHLGEEGDDLGLGLRSWFYVPDWLEMGA
jgi:hypothetical protein